MLQIHVGCGSATKDNACSTAYSINRTLCAEELVTANYAERAALPDSTAEIQEEANPSRCAIKLCTAAKGAPKPNCSGCFSPNIKCSASRILLQRGYPFSQSLQPSDSIYQ